MGQNLDFFQTKDEYLVFVRYAPFLQLTADSLTPIKNASFTKNSTHSGKENKEAT